MLSDLEIESLWGLAETVREPGPNDVVHNDECLFSFDSPFSQTGLYVNLKTWKGVGENFLTLDLQANGGSAAYLHIKHRRETKKEAVVTKLAIGTSEGFSGEDFTIEKSYSVMIFSPVMEEGRVFQLSDLDLPDPIRQVAEAIAKHAGAAEQQQVKSWEALDERPVSKFAHDLIQLPASADKKSILSDPSLWRCEFTGATENLWFNLSDGFIGGGRKNFDGSGGSNGAIDHFNQLKSNNVLYPLAVKLGTITPDGSADVYSYEEDMMVTDPLLSLHLAHWGMDVSVQKKTEKTLAEMEVDLNKDFAFDKIIESHQGEPLEPVAGPGLLGLNNLGNTCYLNSVLQLLFCANPFASKFSSFDPQQGVQYLFPGEVHPPSRTVFEMQKLGSAIHSGIPICVSPFALRNQVCWNHAEFQSGRQQDAVEFLLHLFKEINKVDRSVENLFKFTLIDKLVCDNTMVKFTERSELLLSVQITREDLEASCQEGTKRVKKTSTATEKEVAFEYCLERSLGPSKLQGFRSPLSGEVCDNTVKSFGFKSFPPLLLVTVNRYYFTESCEAAKLDCAVKMPLNLSLEKFRIKNTDLNPDEIPFPEPQAAPEIVAQLTMMGFSEEMAKQAALASNNDMDRALQFCLEDTVPSPASVDGEKVSLLIAMGFSEEHAISALKATNGDPERATDWLFSRIDTLPQEDKEDDGPGNYEMIALVSHLGKSTSVGHYVAHTRKCNDDNTWIVFNDSHVALSKAPPLDYGYIYLYRRIP